MQGGAIHSIWKKAFWLHIAAAAAAGATGRKCLSVSFPPQWSHDAPLLLLLLFNTITNESFSSVTQIKIFWKQVLPSHKFHLSMRLLSLCSNQFRKLVFKFLGIDGFVNLTYLKPYRKFKTYPYCPCCPPKLHSWCSWCFPHRCRLKGTTTRSLQCNAPYYHHRVILDSTLYNFVQPHGWHFLVSFQSFIDNCYTLIVTCFLPESNVL